MGREVRRVAPGWEHPRDERGRHIPLLAGPYSRDAAEWDEGKARWDAGEQRDWSKYPEKAWEPREAEGNYEDVAGERPKPEQYMPEWAPGKATMLAMYEDVSEGTPISPAFGSPEELARWLSDSGASAFAGYTATYEEWLSTIARGFAVSAVMVVRPDGTAVTESGVAAMNR